ncbi:leucine-rich repeat domain-containing protein [Burkholderia cenocepacia]|uniref:hypothetical protein n=2 Tax=Burkholderia cenocepacia TaxID=95486 RepID=UPI00222E7253|nr:hypothetical protein [Burkholderia cenocepacia]MCW3498693.1 hypothetical protein [Burkholderia cenocepacia]MCW3506219.1 hypothetical protein [Burkholderia cenocepacia]MCW3513846.1 hypothetical protein [Burkholderia cenocepacia]MCW3528996.1 hypothetical protein [Burkholderia cenocepacia]MCW3544670.1 hypothetical protein [Burkholderia cenocepacia]
MNLISRYFEQRKIDAFMKNIGMTKDDYTVNKDDMSVNVSISVDLSERGLKLIPIKFRFVDGDFDCSFNELKSLKNCPKKIAGSFNCSVNQITSLEFGPAEIGCGNSEGFEYDGIVYDPAPQCSYSCSNNRLTSLKGISKDIGTALDCSNNALVSLEHLPPGFWAKVNASGNRITSLRGLTEEGCHKYIDLSYNQITSLEGCPGSILSLDVKRNSLQTLEGIPKGAELEDLNVSGNDLVSLEGCPRVLDSLYCSNNKLITLCGGAEHVFHNFDCSSNALTDLVGGPKDMSGNGVYKASNNDLKTLNGAPKADSIKSFNVSSNGSLREFDRHIKADHIDISNTHVKIHECIKNMEYCERLKYRSDIQKPELQFSVPLQFNVSDIEIPESLQPMGADNSDDFKSVKLKSRRGTLKMNYVPRKQELQRCTSNTSWEEIKTSWKEIIKVCDTIAFKEAMEAKLATKIERIEDLPMAKAQSHTQCATRSGKRKI